MILDLIIEEIKKGTVFTDILVRTDDPLMICTPMGWVTCSDEVLSKNDVEDFILNMFGDENWKTRIDQNNGSEDIAKTINGIARLRANIFTCGDSEKKYAVAIRKLPLKIPNAVEIGFPENIITLISKTKGLWLVTGPTGNGKSTTIATTLNNINNNESKHILTIEQPIEYVYHPTKSIITQREVGNHIPNFGAGLHGALRQRPDVIMLGEIRDQESLESMMLAAESGHLVISSSHAKNVEDTLIKISGFFSENRESKLQTLSMTLAGVISQRLLPSIDKKHLILAYEIFINNPDARQLIRKDEIHKINQNINEHRKEGSISLNTTLTTLYKEKKIDARTAEDASYDKINLRNNLY